MTITAIKRQSSSAGRVSVYVDEEYSFSLSDSQLAACGIARGDELTGERLAELQRLSQEGKAQNKALDLLSRRPHAERELRDKLRRKDYEKVVIDAVVDRLRHKGYIDDADFARRWVESRQAIAPRSRRKLQAELIKKGVDQVAIEAALATIDSEDQLQAIRELVAKKQKQSRYQDRAKLLAFLARQGFNYDDIRRVLDS